MASSLSLSLQAESDEDGGGEEEGRKAGKEARAKPVKKEKKALYESHLNESEINRRLKKKQVYQGKLRMASDCCWRGVVVIPGGNHHRVGLYSEKAGRGGGEGRGCPVFCRRDLFHVEFILSFHIFYTKFRC